MRKPALVASDIDGTLLDGMERVSARTARVAGRVIADGVPFVLVTGRPPRWLPPVVAGLGVAGLAVCANGAVLYDTAADRVVGSTLIDPVDLRDVTGVLRHAVPGAAFAVERIADDARAPMDEQFLAEPSFRRPWMPPEICGIAPDELTGKPAIKLLVLHEELTSAELAAAVGEVVGDRLRPTYSTGSGLVELSAPGVDKATGLARVAAELGVDAAEVIAFGDMPNDVPMLSWAGHGVAVGNAHPEVRAVADEITAANTDDGVAAVLERWW